MHYHRYRTLALAGLLMLFGSLVWAVATSSAAPSEPPSLVAEGVETSAMVSAEASRDMEAVFDRGLPLALLVVFMIGLALNLTPCVYPMLAVTVSIFGAQSETRSRRVFGKALVYVLGIATMYSVLGVVAALTGGLFGGLLQSRAVLVGISLLFVGLALSMFGLYELQVPPALLEKLGGSRQPGLVGTFVSGLMVGVFAAPCIGPPIIALLALVGQRADPVFGFLIFFVLSLGLGLPYLILGSFSGLLQKMPRSGEWMVWVRKLFGVVLIGVAAFYVSLAFYASMIFVLVPLTLVVGGVYLGFIEASRSSGPWFARLKKVVGIIAIVGGVLFFAAGRKPSLDWNAYTAQRLEDARRPTVLYFSAEWCIPCLELDRRTFTVPEVARELNRFERLKVDLTHYDSPESSEIREKYTIRGVPTMVFLDDSGRELPGTRRVGFVAAADMLDHIAFVNRKIAGVADPKDDMAMELGLPDDFDDPSRAIMVADVAWVQPGRPFRAGVLFKMRDRWHVYWLNPGDSGTAPQMDWQLPSGFVPQPVQWPHPQRFDDPPFATYGHEDELLLSMTIRTPETVDVGSSVVLRADLDWLVCKEICIAQQDSLMLELEVRDQTPDPSLWIHYFARADERVPVKDPAWRFSAEARGDGYRLSVVPPEGVNADSVMQAEFFSSHPGFLRSGSYRRQRRDDAVVFTLPREGVNVPSDGRLRGVLVMPVPEADEWPRAIEVDVAW